MSVNLNDESIAWVNKYSPQSVGDIAVHPKKIADVRIWLRSALDGNEDGKKIAVFSGPAGCGKSTLIRLLAKEYGLKVHEFNCIDDGLLNEENSSKIFNVSLVKQFKSFLMDCGRYCTDKNNKPSSDGPIESNRLILIDEIPAGFYLQPKRYHDVIKSYIDSVSFSNLVPIVFVLSYNSSQEFPPTFKLFPVDIVDQFKIELITFRPIAVTYLKKAMERVDYYQVLNENEKKVYLDSCSGDIRCLFNTLELRFKHDPSGRLITSKPKRKKVKLDPIDPKSILNGNRDCALDVFHFMGKILHVKRRFIEDKVYNNDFRIYPLHENVTKLLETKIITPSRINLTIHQNYCKNIDSMRSAALIAESLSFSDLFLNFQSDGRFDLSEYSCDLTVRSAMYNLTPSLVDENGEKITDSKKKKTASSLDIPNLRSSKRELILQDRLQFHDQAKSKRDIESSCMELMYKTLPVHGVKSLFLDIFPFVTPISNCDTQVKLMQLYYLRIDELLNQPDCDTKVTSYASQPKEEGFEWIPASAKKRLKGLRNSELNKQSEKEKKILIEEEFEDGDSIENC